MTAVLVALAAALSATAAMGLEVSETADCPSAEAVKSRYVTLAPPATGGGGTGASSQARVIVRDGLLDVSLRNGSGALVGQRVVAAPGRCDDRADVAAALLVAWSAEQEPEVALPYPEGSAPAVLQSPPASRLSQAETRPGAGWRGGVAVAISVLAPLQGDPVTPRMSVELALGRFRSRVEGVAGAGLTGERAVAVGSGVGRWRSASFRLGASASLFGREGGWQLKGAAGAALALVDATGSGFVTVAGGTSLAPEVWGGLRVVLPAWGHVRLVAAAQAARRLRSQVLTTESPAATHELPPLEMELTLAALVSFPKSRP